MKVIGEFCKKFCMSCFCCSYCPKVPWNLTSSCTRSIYGLIFTIFFIGSWVFLALPEYNRKLPFCNANPQDFVCSKYATFLASYRVAVSFSIFFAFMCAITFALTSSRSNRAAVHNGFWFFKLMAIGILLLGALHIPYGLFDNVVMHIGLVFLVTFNIFQLVLYTNLITDLNTFCLVFCWRGGSPCTKFLLTFLIFSLFISGVTIAIFLYILYSSCTLNVIFITVNLVLAYSINVMSITINYLKRQVNSVLKGSVLSTHVMLITWSAITNNPKPECNPVKPMQISSFYTSNFISVLSVWISVLLAMEYFFREPSKDFTHSIVYVEERGKEICGIWGKKQVIDTIHPRMADSSIAFSTTDPDDDEYTSLKYNWFGVHDVLMQATLYMMICFTENYVLEENNTNKFNFHNSVAMWFKLVSSWMCLVVYLFMDLFSIRRRNSMMISH